MGSGYLFLLFKLIKSYLPELQRLRRNYIRELLPTSESMDSTKTVNFSLLDVLKMSALNICISFILLYMES